MTDPKAEISAASANGKPADKTSTDVLEDHTVSPGGSGRPLPPGPPDSGDVDFTRGSEKGGPGFSGTPGAGPNPTKSV